MMEDKNVEKANELKEIRRRIWEARRKTHKNLRNESELAYREVAQDARERNHYGEARIADGAIYQLKERFEDAIWCLEQATRDETNQLKGIAFFFLGSIYREKYPLKDKEKQQQAIECYEKALEDPNFDRPEWARNNLANIYFSLKEYPKAKERYYLSISPSISAKDDSQYITLYNLGRLTLEMEQTNFQSAIAFFNQSYRESGDDYDMKGCCKREMGTAHILFALDTKDDVNHDNKEVISQAIDCWKQAVTEFDEFDNVQNNPLGKSGKSAVALAKIRIANRLLEQRRLDRSTSQITPDEYVLLRWWPPEETGPDGYSTLEERIFSQIEAVKYDRYHQYDDKDNSRFVLRREQDSSKKNKDLSPRNVLAILRGWGSASPLIEDASSACLGGGYFIKWRGKGLIVDPGLDFLYNFRSHGFHMREVNAIIVSHNHTDHNFDLAAIDDIFYEMHKRGENQEEKAQWCYSLYCDKDTHEKEIFKHKSPHRNVTSVCYTDVEWDTDQAGEIAHERLFDLNKLLGLPFKVYFFRTVHSIASFGIRVECLQDNEDPIKIGFTCDTQYFEEIKGKSDKLIDHLQDCNILIAHISQPNLTELLTNNGKDKEFHLGYRGTSKVIKNCNPKLTIIGEFWAGFADMRIDIAKGLKRICEGSVIIPSGIGLFIDPKTQHIECTNCKRWEPAVNIHVTAAKEEFGPLGYICSLCRMKP